MDKNKVVKFKKLSPKAVTPSYSKPGDAGLDLTAISCNHNQSFIEYGTGIAIEIPYGYIGLLFPRSSVTNKSLILKNSVGVIDSNYRGELKLRFQSLEFEKFTLGTHIEVIHTNEYKIGDRVGQLVIVPIPNIMLDEVDELSKTERGEDGYGSTGN